MNVDNANRGTGLALLSALLTAIALISGSCRNEPITIKLNPADWADAPSFAQLSTDFTTDYHRTADSIANRLTTDELIGQVIMPAVFTSSDRATSRLIRHYVEDLKVGGIVWLKGDTMSLITLKPEIDSVARLPLFMAIDAETGLGMRLDGEEVMPAMHYLATASEDSLYDIGVSVGSRARHLGLNMVLGPVLDVAPSRSSVMWRRSISGAPDVVGDLGCGYARGLHDGGVMPVAKHFPGHGATNRDSHQVTPIVNKSAEEFTAQDLLPFKEYVDRRLGGVMVGHLAVPSLGGDSIPATFSHRLVSELLRGEMGFKGLVISDAMNMGGAKSAGDSPYVRALQAGVDIIMAPTDTNEAIEQIRLGLESGELETATLRQAVARIIYCKLILGLMPNE